MKRFFCKMMTILLLLGVQSVCAYEIQRLEPASWWQGFKNPELQLLVYGADIAELRPSVSHPGVTVLRVVTTTNPNYLFVYLDVDPDAKTGSFDIVFSNATARITHPYSLLPKNTDPDHVRGFGPADAIYLITPDRFANGDPANDNVDGMGDPVDRRNPGGRHGGDLAGIAEHLDYIADMGFTAVWLNPVLENRMPDYSYHGYSTTDFYNVDPRYGTNEDYRELVAAAKEKGIGVIMDMIVNHAGSEHWWMADLPSRDWINFDGQFVPTSHERTAVQDPYAAEKDLTAFADGWFAPTMPDLNQRNPLLADYLVQNALWWIEYLGINGIRMDTYPYPDKNFMTLWTHRVMDEYPDFNVVGEEWSLNPATVAYWQRGKDNHDGYVSYLPSVMDFPLQDALRRALVEKERTHWDGLIRLYRILANDVLYPDPAALVTFADNHDMSRIYTQLDEDFDLFRMAMVYLLTMRGTPQIYYGTEILMRNRGTDAHGVIRSDFPGGWDGDRVNARTGKGLSKKQKEAQAFLRRLLNWRKSETVIHSGRLVHFHPRDAVYAFIRFNDTDRVLVILNKNKSATDVDPARFADYLGDEPVATDVLTGVQVRVDKAITVPPRSALLLDFTP